LTDDISALTVSVVSAVSGSAAAMVAGIALRYNALSFNRLRKTEESRAKGEELKVFEGVYRDIARGLKEYRLLKAEIRPQSVNIDYTKQREQTEEEKVRLEKLRVLNSEFLADVTWLCWLIRHGQIKDDAIIRTVKDQIIDWYLGFAERRPSDVGNWEVFADFQYLAQQYIKEKGRQNELKEILERRHPTAS
jgi:hypothetical protein